HLRRCAEIVTRQYEVDHSPNVHRHRALLDAARLRTLDATQRLLPCLLGRKTQVDFLKVVGAHLRLLLRHPLTRQLDALFVGQRIATQWLVCHFATSDNAASKAQACCRLLSRSFLSSASGSACRSSMLFFSCSRY